MTDLKHSTEHKVLLVDHQDETSRNTAFLLRLAGYEVMTVRGLDEAINIISIFCPVKNSPAVVLIDNLPITSGPNGMIDLLANHCRNSIILLVGRDELADGPGESKYRVIPPRHILGEVRKTLLELNHDNDINDNFRRFHSYG